MSLSATYRRLLAAAAIVVALDQVVKQWALEALAGGPITLVPGAVTLRLTFNSGGAFGFFQGRPTVFLVAALAVSAGILVAARRVSDPALLVPLGMILGGGLGNAVDRLARSYSGRVVDFIDLHVWPVFNLADSSIVLGVLAVLALGLRRGPDEGAGTVPATASTEGGARSRTGAPTEE
jgi:signal peptidase II